MASALAATLSSAAQQVAHFPFVQVSIIKLIQIYFCKFHIK
jgi:hypothetical protein